jgi:enoyl-CoA hydratase/carnithine racemase
VSSERAEDLGLAYRVVDDEALAGESRALAARLAEGPSLAHATTKLLLSREQDLDLAGSLELEAMAPALLMTSDDHREFYRAFREGRDPSWRGW